MYRLGKKLKALKPILRSLGKENYSNIHLRVEKARKTLLNTQKEVLTSIQELVLAEQHQNTVLIELLAVQESFLREKSKIQWLKEEEQNTSFFHTIIKGWQRSAEEDYITIWFRWTGN